MIDDYLLTLAIPTYNRSRILEKSLSILENQLKKNEDWVEFLISDNCSTDNTQEIVKRFQKNGLRVNYIVNSENIGMDRNFVQCLKSANGKYIWILGDDDLLIDNALDYIYEHIRIKEYGLIHINSLGGYEEIKEFNNTKVFLSLVSFWITFLSGNIVNKKFIDFDYEKYYPTHLALMPMWMNAAIKSKTNIYIKKKIFSIGNDWKSNGGYNFYEVFVRNYLTIWRQQTKQNNIGFIAYQFEKYRLFRKFIYGINKKILFTNEYKGFKRDKALKYLFIYYWYYPLLYLSLLSCFFSFKKKSR